MKYLKLYNEHINLQKEITNSDLNYYNGFNDKVLQGPKKEFIESIMNDSYMGKDFDWREGELSKKEYDEYSKKYKYCYNARDGHDSLLLFYTNYRLPNCQEFNSNIEYSHLKESKESFKITNILEDIQDILLDIKDEGYHIDIDYDENNKLIEIVINKVDPQMYKRYSYFYKNVQDTIERVKRYLDPLSNNINIYVLDFTWSMTGKWEKIGDNFMDAYTNEIKIICKLK